MNIRLILVNIITLFNALIIIRAILTWVVPYPTHQLHFLLIQITEPVLNPVRNLLRKILPAMRVDFSPLLVILILDGIRNVLIYGIR